MPRFAMMLVCLGCVFTGPAGAVPLSYYLPEIAAYDPGGVLERVDVHAVGKEPYDSYFLQVAMVQGTMAVAQALTDQFAATLCAATGAASGTPAEQWPDLLKKLADDPDGKPDTLALLKQQGQEMERLAGPVTRAAEQVPGLVAQGSNLITRAPGDYSGWRNTLKLGRVMNALRHSAGQLEQAAVDSKRLIENGHTIVTAIPK